MTPGERLVLEDAEEEVRQISEAQDQQGSTGIPRPPVIEDSEIVLEAGVFGFEFSGQPTATAEPGASAEPPPENPCPETVTISFSGITFDCGCVFFTQALTTSFQIEDEGDVNSLAITATLGIHAFPACGDCLDEFDNPQFWEPSLSPGLVPTIYIDQWNNTDCSGPPDDSHFDELVFPVLILLSGTYYLFAFIQSTDTLIFYGTTTNLSSPISNTLSCNANYVTFSDPAITCFNNGSSYDYNVIGHGGTATITF